MYTPVMLEIGCVIKTDPRTDLGSSPIPSDTPSINTLCQISTPFMSNPRENGGPPTADNFCLLAVSIKFDVYYYASVKS